MLDGAMTSAILESRVGYAPELRKLEAGQSCRDVLAPKLQRVNAQMKREGSDCLVVKWQ